MPGKVKVRILAGRNLPIMDRSNDTSDAFVEIKFGSTTYKTDVFRKSLNPSWNSDWFKFEADDEELQDEPIQIRVMDYDTYSANDAIGKIFVDLKPLLCGQSTVITGWFPIFDTMHGIRGELKAAITLDLFSDCNKFRSSSCGVQVFFCPGIPKGYTLQAIQGFVEELMVNDDPEYQWIDKIRTPRASNEARQTLFWKLAAEVQRKIGLKTLELGGNAVVGYQQHFDLEGESGIVLRCIGTAVTLVHNSVGSYPNSPSIACVNEVQDGINGSAAAVCKQGMLHSPAKTLHVMQHHKLSETECSVQRNNSIGSSGGSANIKPVAQHFVFNQDVNEVLEYPFITIKSFPSDFVEHIGGIVSAKSVKILEGLNSTDEPEMRDIWWTEIRMEIRSHTKAMGCNVVLGYSERAIICDNVFILSAQGTAAIVNIHVMCNTLSIYQQPCKDDKLLPDNLFTKAVERKTSNTCKPCHIPYSETSVPFPSNLTKCLICKRFRVPDVLFTTIEPLDELNFIGRGCLIQARVSRSKKDSKGETSAKEISDCLPFLEYELHRQLISKLKLKGMNALFGVDIQISVGERIVIGIASGTGILLPALPVPPIPQITAAKTMDAESLMKVEEYMWTILKQNKELYNLIDEVSLLDHGELQANKQPEMDLSYGNKDSCVLEVDDAEDSDILMMLNEPRYPAGFEMCNVETIPGASTIWKNVQVFTRIWRAKFSGHEMSNKQLSIWLDNCIKTLFFKARKLHPCALMNLKFQVDLPEEDEIQIVVGGMLVKINSAGNDSEFASIRNSTKKIARQDRHVKPGVELEKISFQASAEKRYVELSSLSYIPNGTIQRYLGNLSFCLIRECTDIREYNNLSGFMQCFLAEVQAIARAHVSSLGGNALVSMNLTESVLSHNLHKNQGQSLVCFSGDAVLVEYRT